MHAGVLDLLQPIYWQSSSYPWRSDLRLTYSTRIHLFNEWIYIMRYNTLILFGTGVSIMSKIKRLGLKALLYDSFVFIVHIMHVKKTNHYKGLDNSKDVFGFFTLCTWSSNCWSCVSGLHRISIPDRNKVHPEIVVGKYHAQPP